MRSDMAVDSLDAFMADRRLYLGVLRGGAYGPTFDAVIVTLRKQGRLFEATDTDQLFGWFANKRVDLLLAESIVYVPRLKALGLGDSVLIMDWVPTEKPLVGGLMLSRHNFNATQAQAWQGLIQDMRRDGTLRRIYSHYLGDHYTDAVLAY
jgi:polar amino acid transport system substrate-binding protein